MRIVADQVAVVGPHGPILQSTSLDISGGHTLLVTGNANSGRTALAMALAGRVKPASGQVTLDGNAAFSALRRAVTVVDSPGITAPDESATVRDAVADGLTLLGVKASRSSVRNHLHRCGAGAHATSRVESLPPGLRTRLLLDVAADAPGAAALVLDCPDRHGGAPTDWYAPARALAERRGHAVIVLCTPTSAESLDVVAAHIGRDNRADLAVDDPRLQPHGTTRASASGQHSTDAR